MDDSELLRRYLDERSEEAFRELVSRHIDVVYGAALRRLGGDTHSARDVAQRVFVALARKAASLRGRNLLVGWLHTSARLEASLFVRSERRRRSREEKADAMNALPPDESSASADWDQLRPVIDEALGALGREDREAVLLRFFSGKSFAEVGSALRMSEEAARKRVDRSLDRLRALLARKGLGSTSAALALVLSNQAAAAAPVGTAAAVAAAAWAETAGVAAVAGAGSGFLSMITGTKMMVGVVGALAALAAGSAVRDARNLRSASHASAELEREAGRLAEQRDALSRQAGGAEREMASLNAERQAAAAAAAAAAAQVARHPASNAQQDSARQQLELAALLERARGMRAARYLQYARMFRQLNLSPEQTSELETIMDKEQTTAARTEDLGAELRQLLGADRTQQYYDYKRSVALHNVVDTIANDAHPGSEPFTGTQADQLFGILIANDANYQAGHGTDVSQVNWNAVWGPAAGVLSAEQLKYFQATVEAQLLKMQVHADLTKARSTAGP